MAKDYFQDIIPPEDSGKRTRRSSAAKTHKAAPPPEPPQSEQEEALEDLSDDTLPPAPPDRSIRNVQIQSSRPRRPIDMTPTPRTAKRPRKSMLYILSGVALVLVAGLALVALRPTSVTVTPRTHEVVFDSATQYTAYPADTAAQGTLSYSVKSFDLEESEIVTSTGTTHVENKASGQITILNSYSAAPVKLIKNTRFATPDGLIFRAPAEIMVPGKVGSTPGKITVTVIADEAGEKYNVGPFTRLTLPGLQSTPDMYAGVYAQSSAAFSGGLVGEEPGISQDDKDRAIAAMRSRLADKAMSSLSTIETEGDVVLPFTSVTYETLPATNESGGQVRMHEKAHVSVPVFPAQAFAEAVALSVSVDAANAPISVVPGEGYGGTLISASSTLGSDPIQFGLLGKATILWQVDEVELAQALAGKDQSAFQTIIATFPAIQEARARIQPFWSSTFPSVASKIKIVVKNPTQ